ncbi:cytochrome P450 [Streptomyces sp. NPDC058171]
MTSLGERVRTSNDRRTIVSLIRGLRSPTGQADPSAIYDQLRALGDVAPAPWGAFLVTGYEACSQVLRDKNWLAVDSEWQARRPDDHRWHDRASSDMNKTLTRLNPPLHRYQRRCLGNLFDRDTMTALTDQVEKDVGSLLDDLGDALAHGETDYADLVAERLPIRTVGGWLGIPEASHDRIVRLAHVQSNAQELLPTPAQLIAAGEASSELWDFFTDLVADRRSHPGDDTISRWIRDLDALEPDRAAVDDMLNALTFFIALASLETTSTFLSGMVWLLAGEPGRWSWLRDHPEHVDRALEEVLRYDPPIRFNTRYAAEDTVLAGVPIPKDGMVHVMYGAANRDPRRNADPHGFDMLRTGSHLSFGAGPHYCMGPALARLEARSLLLGLLRRFPRLRVCAPPVYEPRVAIRRVASFTVSA